jgi:hypothetical protein
MAIESLPAVPARSLVFQVGRPFRRPERSQFSVAQYYVGHLYFLLKTAAVSTI